MVKSFEQQIVEIISNHNIKKEIKLNKIAYILNFLEGDLNRIYMGSTITYYAKIYQEKDIEDLLKKHGGIEKTIDENLARIYTKKIHDILDANAEISDEHVKEIKELLNKGARTESQDEKGTTLLMKAIEKDNLDLALFLYEHGASTNIEDHRGCTPLHLAVERNNIEFIRSLKGNKFINYDIDNEHRCTPLFLAAMCNRGEMVDIMVDGGGDVNVYNFEGNTPLIFAVCHDNTKMVDKLALNGANINHKNNERCDAIYYAVLRNNKELVEKLIGYGAKVDTVYKNGETLQSVAKTDEIKKIIEQAQKVKIKGVDQIVISRDREL